MDILITGARGFVGRNLSAALDNIRTGKDRRFPKLAIGNLYLYDLDSAPEILEEGVKNADFVFHLAGVNRPKDAREFTEGNVGFTATLLSLLKACGNRCPLVLSSSVQATCIGRYDSDYGRSKKRGEELLFAYGEESGAQVLVYRFPNLFGKWCRPNYNSAVATFAHNIANDLPITVSDPSTVLELLYIDDLVEEMLLALMGKEHRCDFDGLTPLPSEGGAFCFVPTTHKVSLGEIVDALHAFRDQPATLRLPTIPDGSFTKKLYSTYLSYLPEEKIAVPLTMHCDARGSFTELLRTEGAGQFSVNVTKPGVEKGNHWHNTKWEFFTVVAGEGVIEMRDIGSDRVLSFPVTGKELTSIHILPGYTHSIRNTSDTDDLVTVMWANECFDPDRPDTYFEPVK